MIKLFNDTVDVLPALTSIGTTPPSFSIRKVSREKE